MDRHRDKMLIDGIEASTRHHKIIHKGKKHVKTGLRHFLS